MKPLLFSTLSFFIVSSSLVAQGRKVPLDKAFIEKTIDYYYTIQAKQHPGTSLFYIEKDSLTFAAKTDFQTFKIQYLTADDASAKLPGLKGDALKLDKLMIKWITFDTIDVVITGCTVGERKVKELVNNKQVFRTEKFLTNCTESFVDIPTCRFVYDRNSMKWSQINRGKYLRE